MCILRESSVKAPERVAGERGGTLPPSNFVRPVNKAISCFNKHIYGEYLRCSVVSEFAFFQTPKVLKDGGNYTRLGRLARRDRRTSWGEPGIRTPEENGRLKEGGHGQVCLPEPTTAPSGERVWRPREGKRRASSGSSECDSIPGRTR